MPTNNNPVVIISAARTPMGNMGGYFKKTSAVKLGSVAINAALKRTTVSANDIDEVLMGCVLPAGLGQAPARQAAIAAGIPVSAGCTTINKMCGSGMKSIMMAHDEIKAGSFNMVVAGGMENMSRAPYLIPEGRFGYRIGHAKIVDHMMMDGLEDAYDAGKPMGCFAEDCVEKFNITREEMDTFAINSLERAKKANEDGSFTDEIEPITITERRKEVTITQDENPFKAKPEKIPTLRAAFKKDGTITAANASSISDGAAALILTSAAHAEENSIEKLATIIGHHTHSHEPEWFTTAPIEAIKRLCEKINWDINTVDLFEINEAFAVVTMAAMKALEIPHEKVNIHGGACALGHPIGASGARIVVTLIHALKKYNLKRGIASLCIGGGEATAIAIEI